jgi:hypothetical protein
MTVILTLAAAELAARLVWPEQPYDSCAVADPALGYRMRPNCVSVMKAAEGPWYAAQYNECGYRTPQSCGPAPPATRRIALLGSSVAEGLRVPYQNTIASRLASELTGRCKLPVEVQNLGSAPNLGARLIRRMKEALALHPDLALVIVTPWDVEADLTVESPEIGAPNRTAGFAPDLKRISAVVQQSRAVTIGESFLFRNRSLYVPAYLRYGDKADYLRPPFTPAWHERLQKYDELLGQLSDMAHAAGIPLVLSFVPAVATMTMMTEPQLPPGIDPYVLIRAISDSARRHGVAFVDVSPALRDYAQPDRLYYQVDGHLSGVGQPIAARSITDAIMAGSFPAFADCRTSRPPRMDAAR